MTICRYRDFYAVDLSDVRSQVNIPSCKRKGPRGGVVSPFPVKLYTMLEATREEGLEHIVSWQVHGRCFMIHKSDQFVSDVLPRFFRQTKLPSFQRQLNLWGFQKVVNGTDRGGYYHELFLRGRPDLAPIMLRVKGCAMEGIKVAESNNVTVEDPDFYLYPHCESACVTSSPQHNCITKKDRQEAAIIEPSTPPDSPRSECLTGQSPPRKSMQSKEPVSLVTPPYESRRIEFGGVESCWGHERRKINFQHEIRDLFRTYAQDDVSDSSELDLDESISDDNVFEGRIFQSIEEYNAHALDSILSLEEEALYAKSVLSEVKRMKMCLEMGSS